MSEIFVDTIKNKTGSTSLDSDKLPDMYNGSARAWVNFNGTGTPSIRDSLNYSSITDVSTGSYTTAYTNNLSGTFTNIVGCSNSGASSTQRAMTYDTATASGFSIGTWIDAGSTQSRYDNTLNDFVTLGDLA